MATVIPDKLKLMRVDVICLPSQLRPAHLNDRAVVVFDVLRATTSMASALAAGVKEILVFPDIESVASAKKRMPQAVSCGERNCFKPEGFDLGNSPGDFGPALAGRTLLMSTTNGTKAILAARGASRIFTGAIVNAESVAERVQQVGKDLTLLCAGTNGEPAMEDMLGAGMVIGSLGDAELSDSAMVAQALFRTFRNELPQALRKTDGGKNILKANLEKDIDFAARMNIFRVVGEVKDGDPIRIIAANR